MIVDRPTFAGALAAFEMQGPRFIGVEIASDGSDIAGMTRAIKKLQKDRINPKFIYVVPDFQNPTGITMCLAKREGGLFLWVSVPSTIDTNELFFEALEHKVAFVPGEQFYAENPESYHSRINFSFVAKDQLAEAVRRFAACLQNHL